MLFDRHFENRYCQILDVNIGEWRKQRQPPYFVGYREKSASFDLHSEEFRDVPTPPRSEICERSCQIVNLEDRLVLAVTYTTSLHWNVKIWSMDAHDGTRSITYSIRLFSKDMNSSIMNHFQLWFWTRPLAVSKRGNLFFHDNEKRLYKYYTKTDEHLLMVVKESRVTICLVEDDIWPSYENTNPQRRGSGHSE
ncbi:putative F-box associated domain, type 1 [Arabidopsis thaliana]